MIIKFLCYTSVDQGRICSYLKTLFLKASSYYYRTWPHVLCRWLFAGVSQTHFPLTNILLMSQSKSQVRLMNESRADMKTLKAREAHLVYFVTENNLFIIKANFNIKNSTQKTLTNFTMLKSLSFAFE
jgi:hypothetical protein